MILKHNLKNSKKKAQSLVEYALILAMVAVVAVAALQMLGNNIGKTLGRSGDAVSQGSDSAAEQACSAMGTGAGSSGSFSWDGTSCKYVPTTSN